MNSNAGNNGPDKHFYGRRKNRLIRDTRSAALEQVIAQFAMSQAQDVHDLCDRRKLWLEIGFGGGEHLAAQAKANPDITLIGCEPFINGVSSLARTVIDDAIGNIRLWLDDALPVLQALPDHALDRVFLLFPDPWPKCRHHKRRFIQPHTLELLARVIRPAGKLVLATDDANLAQWMLLHTVQNDGFVWDNAENGDWRTVPDGWVETRYQQKAAQQGRLAHYMLFTRR